MTICKLKTKRLLAVHPILFNISLRLPLRVNVRARLCTTRLYRQVNKDNYSENVINYTFVVFLKCTSRNRFPRVRPSASVTVLNHMT